MPGVVLLEDAEPRADAVLLHAGELLGLAGLLGSGTTSVLRRFFGLAPTPGAARVKGDTRRLPSPRCASAGQVSSPGQGFNLTRAERFKPTNQRESISAWSHNFF
jgi:hypothetical protein